MPLVSGYALGAFAVASNGSGCPHEKQNDGCPGVAVVSEPHEGQRTWVADPPTAARAFSDAAALPTPSGIDGDGAPTEGLARTLRAADLVRLARRREAPRRKAEEASRSRHRAEDRTRRREAPA